ncbi:MAG: shikimate dehydrogenase [Chitinophagaceae bacterium]|nr:shikimate dehydrogenase [Chitinophagaceae bacterium]
MKLYGLIGYPLGHSFSKKYFTEKFERENLDCRFENFPIERIDLLPGIIARHPLLQGLCVTIPYKEKIIPYLHEVSDEVQQIRACNSVLVRDGVLKGFNTDTIGFEESLLRQLRPEHTKALILGTGGASKAVAYVLQKLGIRYQKVSRNKAAGVITYNDVDEKLLAEYLLIINASPAGTFPAVDTFPPLPYQALTPIHFLFDLVYNPAKTIFLQKGEERGASVQNGYDMLVGQAEASWRLWNE